MKRKLLLVFLLLFTFKNFAQSQYEFIVPETWEVDTWNGTSWDNFAQTTYTFNESCLPTVILSQAINPMTSMLENATLSNFTYNALSIVEVAQVWNSTTDEWDNFQKNEHTYNNGNYDLVLKTQIFSWVIDDWELTSQHLYTYDGSDRVSKFTTQTWDSGNMVWINSSETRYTYTASNLVETETGYNWVSNAWEENTLNTSTYINDLLDTFQSQDWDGAQWVNDDLKTFMYDGNDHLTQVLETEWNDATMMYDDDSRQAYTNNAQGYPLTIVSESYIIGSWTNTSRQRYTYPSCAFLSVNDVVMDNISVYPNPSSDKISINVEDEITYNLVNIRGQLINKGVINNASNTIDISSFHSGIYFLNLENGNERVTKKVIKQ